MIRRKVDWELMLPNFASPITLCRIALLANTLLLLGAWISVDGSYIRTIPAFASASVVAQPALLLSLLSFAFRWGKLGEFSRMLMLMFVPAFWTGAITGFLSHMDLIGTSVAYSVAIALVMSLVLLMYTDWRQRRLSPALAVAQFEALQAKIRPHFFFNAINAIIMLLGKSPPDAEEALLDLADLFRATLKDPGGFAKLKDEVDISEKYLRIEKMRFGDRLTVQMSIDPQAKEAWLPPLLLQPLVENAVIHGIEAVGSGVVSVSAFVKDKRLTLSVQNPYVEGHKSIRGGRSNGIAMTNINQRLTLIFDSQATFEASAKDGVWRARISVPFLTQPPNSPKKKPPSSPVRFGG